MHDVSLHGRHLFVCVATHVSKGGFAAACHHSHMYSSSFRCVVLPPSHTLSHSHTLLAVPHAQVHDGTLYVNGAPRTEPFIKEAPRYVLGKLVVPPGDVSDTPG
jgi:hypothetical protein